ncbi:hypothetical protein PDIDSM_5284 [Penicillium digitatum]|nr:hypothetical protein PDIDSM_5284 [Penicillium digitatum]
MENQPLQKDNPPHTRRPLNSGAGVDTKQQHAKGATMRLNALGEDLNFFDGSLHRPASAGNPIACRMLLDCGASHTFVSLETAKRLGGKWDKRKSLPADGPKKVVGAVDVEGYDVVLGNDFLCKHDPHVSFPTKKMWLTDRYGEHEVRAVNARTLGGENRGTLNLLSKRDIRRTMKEKDTEYAVFYATNCKDLDPSTSAPRLAELLQKFADVFPDDLPRELPPNGASSTTSTRGTLTQ